VAAALFGYGKPELRHAVETEALGWLQARHEARAEPAELLAQQLRLGCRVVQELDGLAQPHHALGQVGGRDDLAQVDEAQRGAQVGAWFTAPGQRFFDFSQEAVVETKKVVWPSRKETMQTTGIVFAFVLAMAIVLWLTDKTLEWVLYDLVLGWKK
jgi:preprotein translocase SecE subunit